MDDESTGDATVAFFDVATRLLANCNDEIDQIKSAINDQSPRHELTLRAAERKKRIHVQRLEAFQRWPEVAGIVELANASARQSIYLGEDWAGGLIAEAVGPVARLVINLINVVGFPDEERSESEVCRDIRVVTKLMKRLPKNWTKTSGDHLEMERQRCLAWIIQNDQQSVRVLDHPKTHQITIPPEKRTKPMTKKEAAKILRPRDNPKAAVRWLTESITDGNYRFERLPNSYKGYFHLDDDWPAGSRDKLTS
ncbi:MAG: hypothetical protein KDB00_13915 [Planctomycetales bacterium]|nr:hypothetical protein [Planctomycetales bacterium]